MSVALKVAPEPGARTMKLQRLRLVNFKGIREFTLDAGGRNVVIYGDNATGKTTLFDAFLWLLFDKDSQNRKDFEIKTLDANGKAISGLSHEVEAAFEIGGRLLTLRKVYAEKWTKKRGSVSAEFTGHITDYFVDGVPVKKNEYQDRIAAIVDENVFRLLTNPTYFNESLHWTDRRRILLEVCGDISDADVISSSPKLADLQKLLGNRTLDDHRKVIAARRSEINKELEKIPVRIDEAERNLPDISGINVDVLPADITKLRAQLSEKQQEKARIESGGEVAEKRRQLAEIERDLLNIQNQHRAEIDEKINTKRRQLSGVNGRIMDLKASIASYKRRIDSIAQEAAQIESRMRFKREEWHQTNGWQFELHQDTTCPTCGQPLPEEQLEEARQKALADFNRYKAEQLEQISTSGKALKAQLERLMAENSDLVAKVNDDERELSTQEAEAARIQAEIEALAGQNQPITNNPYYQQKLKEKEQMESQIAQLQAGNQEAIAEVMREIALINQAIEALDNALVRVRQRESGLARIEELKAQEKALAAEYERLESELFLTEEFIRTKVRLLEERINSRFKLARFKLFDVQVNGGVVECCETLYKGVPYSGGLNNAARINVGIDIINTLSEHYGFTAPIFIDNREAVTKLAETGSQVISLVVSEADKNLRVEVM